MWQQHSACDGKTLKWGVHKWRYPKIPKWMFYDLKKTLKWMIWGSPHLWKPSNQIWFKWGVEMMDFPLRSPNPRLHQPSASHLQPSWTPRITGRPQRMRTKIANIFSTASPPTDKRSFEPLIIQMGKCAYVYMYICKYVNMYICMYVNM